MQIKELYLKHFGKFTDEKITVSAGINVFYGENESGKSTIFAFIRGMLFGMERGRGRAASNDTFTLYEPWENSNYYAGVLRFESGGKTFRLERNFDKYARSASLICEDDGEEFSLEHGDLEMLLNGLTLSGFENTAAVGQLKVETNQSLASELRNYAVNYYTAGNSDIDLVGALQILKNNKKEIEKEVKAAFAKKQEKRSRVEQEAAFVWRDLHGLNEEMERLKAEIKERKEWQISAEKAPPRRRVNPILATAPLVGVIIAVMLFPHPWDYMIVILLILADLLYIWNCIKEGKKTELKEIGDEAKLTMEQLTWELKLIQESIKEKQTQYDNLQEQLQEFAELGDEFREQDEKCRAIDIATSQLNQLSGEINKEIGQKLSERASEILGVTTAGKYIRLIISENLDMQLLSEGRKIAIEKLSRGTIEQVYFALRIAAGEILYEEAYPLILDDTFAYYDDSRLENTIKWLADNKEQVLIFTCHRREPAVLDKLNIRYHLTSIPQR
ncbi:MAG: ATP-binding protein [Lachnospiraceae bacterium]